MGGDHKCPVCQATFTRPQHVARHMRSHTGDRPYKCQYCGDQFARSDLLSRHVNKCHANEKPLPRTGTRRNGTASASRATTSKQACDQCVQSSLPCDGCNPCSKCITRKCRCTYVKFHRQTAPAGPGHTGPPRPVPPNAGPNGVGSLTLNSTSAHPSSSHQFTGGLSMHNMHAHGNMSHSLSSVPLAAGLYDDDPTHPGANYLGASQSDAMGYHTGGTFAFPALDGLVEEAAAAAAMGGVGVGSGLGLNSGLGSGLNAGMGVGSLGPSLGLGPLNTMADPISGAGGYYGGAGGTLSLSGKRIRTGLTPALGGGSEWLGGEDGYGSTGRSSQQQQSQAPPPQRALYQQQAGHHNSHPQQQQQQQHQHHSSQDHHSGSSRGGSAGRSSVASDDRSVSVASGVDSSGRASVQSGRGGAGSADGHQQQQQQQNGHNQYMSMDMPLAMPYPSYLIPNGNAQGDDLDGLGSTSTNTDSRPGTAGSDAYDTFDSATSYDSGYAYYPTGTTTQDYVPSPPNAQSHTSAHHSQQQAQAQHASSQHDFNSSYAGGGRGGYNIHRGSVSSNATSASESAPSSAASSSAHLPLPIPIHGQGQGEKNDTSRASVGYSSSLEDRHDVHSAFGLMSLDDPAVIAGTATDGQPFFSKPVTLDMDTPMPMKRGAGQLGLDTPSGSSGLMRSASTGTGLSSLTGALQTPSRDFDSREMRDFWKQYMRTPLSGPMDGRLEFGMMQSSKAAMTPGSGYRRQRVASLPSVKTPVAERDSWGAFAQPADGSQQQHNQERDAKMGPMSSMRTTLHNSEDLRSYEAAVLARKAPTTLNLQLKKPLKKTGSSGSDVRQSSTESVPQQQQQQTTSPDHTYGSSQQRHQQGNNTNTQYGQRISSTPAQHFSFNGPESESGGSPAPLSSRGSSVDPDGSDRPSFKRLPSQTLGPENAKRPFLGYDNDHERVSGWNVTSNVDNGGSIHTQNHTQNAGLAPISKMSLGLGGISHPDRVVASLAERRRRRMSAPSTSLPPLDPNPLQGKEQQQMASEMKPPSMNYAPQATGGMAG